MLQERKLLWCGHVKFLPSAKAEYYPNMAVDRRQPAKWYPTLALMPLTVVKDKSISQNQQQLFNNILQKNYNSVRHLLQTFSICRGLPFDPSCSYFQTHRLWAMSVVFPPVKNSRPRQLLQRYRMCQTPQSRRIHTQSIKHQSNINTLLSNLSPEHRFFNYTSGRYL